MEALLIQNNYTFNLVVVKTRRYRALLKLYSTPFIALTLHKQLVLMSRLVPTTESIPVLINIKSYYMKDNLWFFYRSIIYSNSGLLSNNISTSYTYKTLKCSYSFIFNKKFTNTSSLKVPSPAYAKHFQILPISVQKFSFKKMFLFVLFNLLLLNKAYSNCINISYGFLILPTSFRLLWFYNFYYYKVHNY
jgi:hypothetical protein